jgi:hypothetical protein
MVATLGCDRSSPATPSPAPGPAAPQPSQPSLAGLAVTGPTQVARDQVSAIHSCISDRALMTFTKR